MARHDTGAFPAVSPETLRRGATLLAAVTGAGAGVMLGVAFDLVAAGEPLLASAAAAATVVVAASLVFIVLQARVIAQLVEHRDHGHADLATRLARLETELARRIAAERDLDTGALVTIRVPDTTRAAV